MSQYPATIGDLTGLVAGLEAPGVQPDPEVALALALHDTMDARLRPAPLPPTPGATGARTSAPPSWRAASAG